jgi:hypothetical protein
MPSPPITAMEWERVMGDESSQIRIDAACVRGNFVSMTRSFCHMAMPTTLCTCVCAEGLLVSGGSG